MNKGRAPNDSIKHRSQLKVKTKEALSAVMPITVIVLLLCLTITPVEPSVILLFLFGAVLLVIGMGMFTLGTDTAMTPMGEHVGSSMSNIKSPWLIAFLCFLIGLIVTIAEPDLTVLAKQTPGIPDMVIILTVAIGVGIFLALAFLRIYFKIKLTYLLIGLYTVVFVISIFTPSNFWAVAFDSGGVTTGPITVPFIISMGVGLSAIKRSGSSTDDDSFGLVAICSIGPVISMLVLGMLYNADSMTGHEFIIPDVENTAELWDPFLDSIIGYMKEVALALVPILLFFFIYQSIWLKLRKRAIIRILFGVLFSFIGLTLFFTGVNVGFMPVGNHIGASLGALDYNFILIPLGMVMGFFILKAEPAVHVLNRQVEEISAGAVTQKTMMNTLSAAMAISLGLSMLRLLTGVSIMWFLLPGYSIALILSLFVPQMFTAIAFDSGGVASGPMTATFLLPFAIGVCDSIGGNVMTDAFGIVAMVAMTPLIAIQMLGLVYAIKTQPKRKRLRSRLYNTRRTIRILSFGDSPEDSNDSVEKGETVADEDTIDTAYKHS